MRVAPLAFTTGLLFLAASPLLAQKHYGSSTVEQVGSADCDGAPLWTEDKATLTVALDGKCTGGRYTGSVKYEYPSTIPGTVSADQKKVTLDAPLSARWTASYTYTPSIAMTPPISVALKMYVRPYAETFDETRRCSQPDIVKSGVTGAVAIGGTLQCSWSELPIDNLTADLFSVVKVTATDAYGFQDSFTVNESAIWYYQEPGPQTGELTGTINRVYGNKTYWLPDVPVELLDPTGVVVLKTYARENPQNTSKSWYRLELPPAFDFSKDYRLHVALQSDPDTTLAKLLVFSSPTQTKPIELFSRPFRIVKDTSNTKNVNVDRGSADIEIASIPAAVNAEAGVEVYWNIWRELYITRKYIDDRPLKYNLPLEVYLNAPSTFYCINAAAPTCPAASSMVLQPRDSLPGGDPTVLWHEFGHYMVSEIHGGGMLPPPFNAADTNRNNAYHLGFANSYSTLALDDGFATFWSWISSDLLDTDHTPQLFYNQVSADGTRAVRNDGYASEWNWAAWDVRRPASGMADLPRGEEFAIAALLWDLFDKVDDVEDTTRATWTFGGASRKAVDSISVPADQIVTIFRNRKPRTVLELYNALKAELPATLTSLSGNPRNSGLSQLDELFVMQGLFADTNGNWAYDAGETIGKPANFATWNGGLPSGGGVVPIDIAARPWRENVPPLPNSFVNLVVPGTSPATMTVSYSFGPGLEKLNTSRQYAVSSGPFYLEMPSPNYPAEAILSVPGAAPLRIANQLYWSAPRRTPTLGTHTFSPIATAAPAISSLSAASAPTGAEITINGTNFSTNPNNNIVRFGNAIAYVPAATPTKLTVVTPPIAAGSAPVTVEVGGAVSNSAAFSIVDTSACRYYVDLSGAYYTGDGGVSRVFIYAKPNCQWSISSQAPWLTVDRPGVHNGNLAVEVSAQPNRTGKSRSTFLLVNDSKLEVVQLSGDAGRRRVARH